MTQTYSRPYATDRMRKGLCPECGWVPEKHNDGPRRGPSTCGLLPHDVTDRIAKQRQIDQTKENR